MRPLTGIRPGARTRPPALPSDSVNGPTQALFTLLSGGHGSPVQLCLERPRPYRPSVRPTPRRLRPRPVGWLPTRPTSAPAGSRLAGVVRALGRSGWPQGGHRRSPEDARRGSTRRPLRRRGALSESISECRHCGPKSTRTAVDYPTVAYDSVLGVWTMTSGSSPTMTVSSRRNPPRPYTYSPGSDE